MCCSRTLWKSICTGDLQKRHCRTKNRNINKLKNISKDKGGVELESISIHDLRAYVTYKENQGLKPQSIVAVFKVIRAFFSW
ncbi:hypothetical protein J1TS3_24840 [Siminovitchia fordii]|uniref:Core-binding (CB) domain-containing protein n=1 Tax=Siminovitchia fordii TaxID=254759 RepID=A0ABQ4K8I5_9BACI|nr:hypothetical protein J1TS3_24840 [Siminovitchia fordii]